MPSKNKTPNIGLNQWKGNEYAKREDFINDNLIIDREIKDLQKKADEVEQNAKNYTDTTAFKKVDKVAGKELSTEDYTTTDKNKLAGIQVGANKYVHPSKHSASIITQSATHRFTTDQEKAYWNGLESLLKAYADAATAGIVNSAPETLNNLNKLAQALNDDPDFANTISNQIKNKVDKVSGKKLSSNDYTTSDKNKLAGIATGANKYIHPTTHSLDIITETSDKKVMTNAERDKLSTIENNANKYIHPSTHNLNQITETSTKKVMTSSERNKLSGIQLGAQVNRGISDSVTSTSTTTNASSKAAKTAYDKAITALNTANAKEPKITKKSGFNLNKSDSVSSTSTSTLATSKAVKTSYDKGNNAYNKIVSGEIDILKGNIYNKKGYWKEEGTVYDVSSFDARLNEYVHGLAWDGKYLWCTQYNDRDSKHKIYKLSTSGTVISSFDSPSDIPEGLTFDGEYLWCADNRNDKIHKLSTSATIISSFNSPNNVPKDLAWDGRYIWCFASGNGDDKTYKLSTSGTVISSFDSPSRNIYGLTWDGSYLWGSGTSTYKILYRFNTIGTIISSYERSLKSTFYGLAWDGRYLWGITKSGWITKLNFYNYILVAK